MERSIYQLHSSVLAKKPWRRCRGTRHSESYSDGFDENNVREADKNKGGLRWIQ
ncbi:hypothetical protein DPMN_050170 [Dreissena polymorpha]|uniref:Uncharacterized protein n=1 Tax=Dreissena polymorpha TaxID=45954 RepID=A0A9D4CFL9_DREPO|nr:hypothetical protein DPMN_050170 [Dreissena polymorpha]